MYQSYNKLTKCGLTLFLIFFIFLNSWIIFTSSGVCGGGSRQGVLFVISFIIEFLLAFFFSFYFFLFYIFELILIFILLDGTDKQKHKHYGLPDLVWVPGNYSFALLSFCCCSVEFEIIVDGLLPLCPFNVFNTILSLLHLFIIHFVKSFVTIFASILSLKMFILATIIIITC